MDTLSHALNIYCEPNWPRLGSALAEESMRFESRQAASGGRTVALASRTLERPAGTVKVEAPAHWTTPFWSHERIPGVRVCSW